MAYRKREGEVKRAATPAERREQYVNLATQSFELSRDHFQPWYTKAAKWYKLYRGYKQGKLIPYRNNIAIPILFSMVQNNTARIVDISLGGSGEPITFMAGGPEDQVIARKRTALNAAQFEDADIFDVSTRMLVGASVFGTSVAKYTWAVEREQIYFRADLGAGEAEYTGEEFTFDGPVARYVRMRDFFPQPGVARIRDMRWVVERFFLDLEDINRLAEDGFFEKAGAAEVQMDPKARQQPQDATLVGYENPASERIEGDWGTTDYEKPIEILQFWGRVPRALGKEGQVNLVITVAARKHLLRAGPNPFGRLPFGEFAPIPDPDYFHRPSMVESVEKLQTASNAMASQKLDALQLATDPVFLVNSRVLPDTRKWWVRPGGLLRVEGPIDGNIAPLSMDLRGLANTYTELEQQMQWMEQGTGIIRDAMQGFSGPDRETARGFVGRQTAANIRTLMGARLFERQFLEKTANWFVQLNRRYLTFPHQLRAMGTSALLDPLTFRPIPMEGDTLGVNEMLPDYEARAMGSLRGVDRDTHFQKLLQVMQVAGSNPVMAQFVNWVLMLRHIMLLSGVPNADELMGTDAVILNLAAQMQQAAIGGEGESGVPSARPKELGAVG